MRHTAPRRGELKTLSIKVPRSMSARVVRLAKARRTTVSAVVRDALERYAGPERGSFGEMAADFIGTLSGGPGDLATNAKHMKGYGAWRR